MSELPKGWALATLADVTAPRGEKADPTTLGEIAFLGMDHIEAHTAKLLGSQPVSELKSAVVIFKEGDILYGRLRPYLNKVHLAQFDGAASAEFIVLPPSEAIAQRFLQSLLRSPEYRALADQRSTGDRPRVKFENVGDYAFPLPPLPEQRRIVRKLDTLSARTTTARSHLTAIAKLVERYRTSVLEQEFFGAHTEGWEKVSFLQTVQSTQNGLSKRRGDDGQPCKVLRLADLSGNVFIGDSPREIVLTDKEQQKFALTSGDIAIVRVNGSEKIVGRMIVWGEEEGWTYCDHFIRARLSDEFDPSFVRWLFETDTVRAQIEASFVSSAGQKTINKTILSQIMVQDISMEEQREIVRRIETAFANIDRLAAEAEKALKLTDRLDQRILAKAFAGALVPQNPTDEPATELLARIREVRATVPKRGRRKKAEA